MSRQTKYLNALALACALSLPLFVQAHEGHDDAPPPVSGDSPRRQSDGSWLVSGSANVDDVLEDLTIGGEDSDSVTVSGLVQEKLGRVPKVGDHFALGRYDGTVTRAAHRRVLEIRLTQKPAPAGEEKN